jgi:hypothetical protein
VTIVILAAMSVTGAAAVAWIIAWAVARAFQIHAQMTKDVLDRFLARHPYEVLPVPSVIKDDMPAVDIDEQALARARAEFDKFVEAESAREPAS